MDAMKKILFFLFLLSITFNAFGLGAKTSLMDKNVRLQIFLLKNDFSPGKIDGKSGKFTALVLNLYKKAHPLESNLSIEKSLAQISPLFISYKIQDEEKKFVGVVPDKPSEQAHKKYMPYRFYAELIADRYHTDIAFLQQLNPKKNMKRLKPGDEVTVPNVEPFRIENISDQKVHKQTKFAKRTIKINTKTGILTLYEGEKTLAVFPVTSGSKDLPSPKGVWKIKKITYLPFFRYDKKMLNEGKYSNKYYNIPPGPNSPVGIVWMGLNKTGIGIHGTDTPHTIGRSVSHGCIRLSNSDAVKLSKMVTFNIPVHIE
jgi:lipoprotein-anchoring transpeptidase ErfK/SrfK